MGNNNANEVYVYVDSSSSASLLRSQTGGDCDFDIGNGLSQFEAANGEIVLAFDLPSCIDTADNNDAIKQNGGEVEFSFNTMVYK
jgi:hypothetical protein